MSDAGRADAQREVRRAEQEADALVALAARHLERGADAVHRDEAELAHRGRVGGAGDETSPSRPSAGWHAFQSRNGSSGCTVRPTR